MKIISLDYVPIEIKKNGYEMVAQIDVDIETRDIIRVWVDGMDLTSVKHKLILPGLEDIDLQMDKIIVADNEATQEWRVDEYLVAKWD